MGAALVGAPIFAGGRAISRGLDRIAKFLEEMIPLVTDSQEEEDISHTRTRTHAHTHDAHEMDPHTHTHIHTH